jgi:hypothetical protein
VTAGLDDQGSIDIASEAGRIVPDDDGTSEVVWRLVVRGEALDGQFAPRGGTFVGLAESAGLPPAVLRPRAGA